MADPEPPATSLQRDPCIPLTPPKTPSSKSNGCAQNLEANSTTSQLSLSTVHSTRSRREYMDSLVPPSKDEFEKISSVQQEREAEIKTRFRSQHPQQRRSRANSSRQSIDSKNIPPAAAPARTSAEARRQSTSPSGSHLRLDEHAHPHLSQVASRLGLAHGSTVDEIARARAALVIQRSYRGYRGRREMNGYGLDATSRWTYAIRDLQFREATRPRARSMVGATGGGPSQVGDSQTGLDGTDASAKSLNARQNWKKLAAIARRAGEDEKSDDSSSDSDSSASSGAGKQLTEEQKQEAKRLREQAREQRRKDAMMMGLQYFLEMVDLKHRYGSNLRVYHEEWKRARTNENFFYWLDYGEGRNLEVEACPRERLDREQVRYLTREERQYYLVKVDDEGRLCWAKNGVRIDTTEQWKDSIHGIVPADDPTPAFQPISSNNTRLLGDESTIGESTDSENEASESELEAARAAKYATPGLDQAKGLKKIHHLSATTIFNKLLRKSVRKNTWIFVADTSFRLYVGIKNSGAFQHSSFLQGSRISAAGLIKIKNGRLASLSPLSGHYRPPASNFRAFVRSLKDEGVDMSHVSISKSYAVLVGLEVYVKTRRRGKELLHKLTHHRDKIIAPDEVARREEEQRDKSASAAREREVLDRQHQQEERQREENKVAVQVMQKLNILPPREPAEHKGGDELGSEKAAVDVGIDAAPVTTATPGTKERAEPGGAAGA